MTVRHPDWLRGRATDADHAVAGGIDLLLDVAWHDGDARDLAVAAEAWSLIGFHDGSIDIAHAGPAAEVRASVWVARRGRQRRLLRADARGVVKALYALAENGLLTRVAADEAVRLRWLARGGHDR